MALVHCALHDVHRIRTCSKWLLINLFLCATNLQVSYLAASFHIWSSVILSGIPHIVLWMPMAERVIFQPFGVMVYCGIDISVSHPACFFDSAPICVLVINTTLIRVIRMHISTSHDSWHNVMELISTEKSLCHPCSFFGHVERYTVTNWPINTYPASGRPLILLSFDSPLRVYDYSTRYACCHLKWATYFYLTNFHLSLLREVHEAANVDRGLITSTCQIDHASVPSKSVVKTDFWKNQQTLKYQVTVSCRI